MKKTIVCIIEEEMMLNYLFVSEMYKKGDSLLFISSFENEPYRSHLTSLFKSIPTTSIKLEKDGDEELWDTICRTIRAELNHDSYYVVNLSSGTRLMSLATQQVFEKFNSQFYFMPADRNVIINSQIDDNNDNNDDLITDIKYKVTIEEYMRVCGIKCKCKKLTQSKEYSEDFFTLFSKHHLSGSDYDLLEELRNLRDKNIDTDRLDGLQTFLDFISFPQQSKNRLTKYEVQYLTGNWFEEYVYHLVKEMVNPDDIAIGVEIQRMNSESRNDLDVVFIVNNKLYVIECKTGVGKVGLFNQIVYKACALKEALLGTRSSAFIFALNTDSEDKLQKIAKNLGITFCDKADVNNHQSLKGLLLNN